MKRYLSRLFALLLVVTIGLVGCSKPSGLTGKYSQDTLDVVASLRNAIELPNDAPEKAAAQTDARKKINDFAALYWRDSSLKSLRSFTTMRTALNALGSHYASYPNRPVPEKLKKRLEVEFKQIETAINQGA
ncbi:photosystem II protein Psb27 [Floridanema aerugineum]|jgi:photosystem II Psb27 protein|uniref:Photosystem II lipoprotein Psb27 n=1 Tax=Floridaenema aerugineum BLCC-F46 TaxID=3153654 RepID=A0ABV4X926_9CYAN